MDETISVDYPSRESAEEALRMALAEGEDAKIERHQDKWRVTWHRDDGEDDAWMVTRLETF